MKRLAFRFGLGIALAILVAFGLTAYIFVSSFERQVVASTPPMAELCLANLVSEVDAKGGLVDDAELAELGVAADMPTSRVAADDPSIPPSALDALSRGEAAMAWADPGFTAVVPLQDGQVLLVGPHRFDLQPSPGDLIRVLVVLVSVVGSVAFLMALPVVRRLQRLERAAQALGAGELGARVPEPRDDDAISQLARRFNAMADRVQGLLEGQQRLVQAVAHEIRTPITRLRFGAEMLDMTEDPVERERRRLELEGDLEELEAMVQELLLYSRYESGQAPLDPQRVPIRTSLERLVGKLPPGAPTVELAGSEGTPDEVLADSRAFNRALRNLLANAARHAATAVRVSWRAEGEALIIAVEDDGPGVPEGDRERVFEPFARLDAARERSAGGVGLGLAIVQRILLAHGGTVTVADGALGGARFETRWPCVG
jgi:two-component system, OmpR family, sensor histidine kinase RstB